MTAYFVGDTPAGAIGVVPSRNGEEVDVHGYTNPRAVLIPPGGAPVDLAASIDDDEVRLEWPATSPFEVSGIYAVRLLLDTENGRETFSVGRIVVEEWSIWHNLATAREDWRDAPDSDVKLYTLLYLARDAVEAYAPKLADGATVPLPWVQAQLLQARNHWNAARVDPANAGLGDDQFTLTPFPLDWNVRQIIRPKTAVPVIG